MTVIRYQTAIDGANPFNLDGPIGTVAGASKDGVFVPQFKAGHVSYGDSEAELVYCKLVLASATTLTPGDWYSWDDDFTATLYANGVAAQAVGCPIGIGLVNAPASAQAAAGTYYLWLLRAGQAPARYTTIIASTPVESTATAGAVLSKAGAGTASAKSMTGAMFVKGAPATFTADVTNGSKILANVSTGLATLDSGPFIGATLSGTGVAASQKIEYIQVNPPQGPPGVSIVMSAAGTVTGTGVTITPTLVQECRIRWPVMSVQN